MNGRVFVGAVIVVGALAVPVAVGYHDRQLPLTSQKPIETPLPQWQSTNEDLRGSEANSPFGGGVTACSGMYDDEKDFAGGQVIGCVDVYGNAGQVTDESDPESPVSRVGRKTKVDMIAGDLVADIPMETEDLPPPLVCCKRASLSPTETNQSVRQISTPDLVCRRFEMSVPECLALADPVIGFVGVTINDR